jgi:hypothetical protein
MHSSTVLIEKELQWLEPFHWYLTHPALRSALQNLPAHPLVHSRPSQPLLELAGLLGS